jgi:hypothetical protein
MQVQSFYACDGFPGLVRESILRRTGKIPDLVSIRKSRANTSLVFQAWLTRENSHKSWIVDNVGTDSQTSNIYLSLPTSVGSGPRPAELQHHGWPGMRCEIESIESKAAKVRTRNAAAEICVLRFNSLTRLGINPGPHSETSRDLHSLAGQVPINGILGN